MPEKFNLPPIIPQDPECAFFTAPGPVTARLQGRQILDDSGLKIKCLYQLEGPHTCAVACDTWDEFLNHVLSHAEKEATQLADNELRQEDAQLLHFFFTDQMTCSQCHANFGAEDAMRIHRAVCKGKGFAVFDASDPNISHIMLTVACGRKHGGTKACGCVFAGKVLFERHQTSPAHDKDHIGWIGDPMEQNAVGL